MLRFLKSLVSLNSWCDQMETDGICTSQTWQKAVSEWVISSTEENHRDSKGALSKEIPYCHVFIAQKAVL